MDHGSLGFLKSRKSLCFPKQNQHFFNRSACTLGPCLFARQTITVGMDFCFFSAGASYRIGNQIDRKWSRFGRIRKRSRHGWTQYRNISQAALQLIGPTCTKHIMLSPSWKHLHSRGGRKCIIWWSVRVLIH